MAYKVLMATSHGLIPPEEDVLDPSYDDLSPTEALAKFTARLADTINDVGLRGMGFNCPLTVTLEEVDRG